ncbi:MULTISPECIES: caspase family protein [unclassified Streptomyces]|uniref:caspase family protein n=1 Tax=unclassified Streptomyces TaxID=2593676 RepID=UPI00094028D0|nr:caspase family protein [Streptomyces sp. TSRI0107]
MPLSDPSASRAVIIGVDTYQSLEDLPAVANNIERLAALLTAEDVWGLPPAHLTVLSNPTSKDAVLDAVHTAATEAEDALLVYFAGHGLLTADAGLRLALPHTDADRLYRGVAYDDVRDLIVQTGRALARVVILDCCYSGSALTGYMGAATGIANRTMAEGTYVMTSSAETKPAMAPPGEKYTAFTGELLRVIEEGVPGGPDPMPMDVLFTEVRDRLAARRGIPAPQQRARNAGHAIALVRNRWEEPPSVEEGVPAEEEAPPVRLPVFPRLARLLHPLLVMAAVVSLPFVAAPSALLGGGSDDPCGGGSALKEVEGECVGVSDGIHSFMPELNGVSRRIALANLRVPDDEPFVTIALLAPLTAADAAAKKRILHQVQGAYAAQRLSNDAHVLPYVRLVLAHPGEPSRMADQLVDMARSEEHNLRGVVGLDMNRALIGDIVKDVTDEGIPAVAGSFTPNSPGNYGLDNGSVAWIMPSAEDQVSALVSADKDVATERRSVLVQDKDTRKRGYVEDLRDAFREQLGDALHDTAPYSSAGGADVTERQFRIITANLCALPAAVENVLFAGAPADLRHFVHALARRPCWSRTFTVISGSEASALHEDPELDWDALDRTGITVEYTAGAHPETEGDGMEELKDVLKRLRPELGTVDLTDGEAISAYDSTLTAARTVQRMADPGKVPGTGAVTAGFLSLRLDAASGRICLDAQGRASNKAVHVLRLDPARRAPRLVATAYPRPGGCG